MKSPLALLCLLAAGCQTPAPRLLPLPPPNPGPEPKPIAAALALAPTPSVPSTNALEQKLVEQKQLVEALMSQNDALTARLQGSERTAPSAPTPSTAAVLAAAEAALPKPPAAPPANLIASPAAMPTEPTPLLVPNTDGVIDATGVTTVGVAANPFAVRTLPADAVREISLVVQGILTGPTPCALVNGRITEPGESIESLRFSRLTADTLILGGDGFALNLPLGATKVRLAL